MGDKISAALKILKRPFSAGTRVTNCVTHANLDFDKRPSGCLLCFTDVKNHLSLCVRVNEFLNEVKDAAISELEAS